VGDFDECSNKVSEKFVIAEEVRKGRCRMSLAKRGLSGGREEKAECQGGVSLGSVRQTSPSHLLF